MSSNSHHGLVNGFLRLNREDHFGWVRCDKTGDLHEVLQYLRHPAFMYECIVARKRPSSRDLMANLVSFHPLQYTRLSAMEVLAAAAEGTTLHYIDWDAVFELAKAYGQQTPVSKTDTDNTNTNT